MRPLVCRKGARHMTGMFSLTREAVRRYIGGTGTGFMKRYSLYVPEGAPDAAARRRTVRRSDCFCAPFLTQLIPRGASPVKIPDQLSQD